MLLADYILSKVTTREQTTNQITDKVNKGLPEGLAKQSPQGILYHLNNLLMQDKVSGTESSFKGKKTLIWKKK